jgi:hypothetical protein
MRRYLPVYIVLFCAGGATSASAQLLSERVDGLSRICSYAGTANVVTGSLQRTHRVGIGQNCPITFPEQETSRQPAPPTAELRTETVTATGRACVYEEAGTRWSLLVPALQRCPLYAGLAQQAANARRLQPPDESGRAAGVRPPG